MKFNLNTIYQHSPVFLQNLGVSWHGLKLYRREYGKKFERLLDEFKEHERWSIDQLRQYQNDHLQTLVEHCYQNVPYYRRIMDELKLKPADIRSVEDLPKLPVLTRDDVRNNMSELVTANCNRSELIPGHTSGTTGSPLQFYYDKEICVIKNAVDWRQKNWAGIVFGDRIAFFYGRHLVPLSQKRPPFWRYNRIHRHLYFSSFHMSSENLKIYFDKLSSFRPLAIEAYPSNAYTIATYLLERKLAFPVKAVFTTAETLYPHQRDAIEKAFCCKVFDNYGMAERVVFATECEAHLGLHLNMDYAITEILNRSNTQVGASEPGQIVGTGLHNYAMPLLRYKTDDLTVLRKESCSCGRPMPLLETMTTKAGDIIKTKDGRFIAPASLTHPFKPMKSIAHSQIIQEDINRILIRIVRLPNYTSHDSEYLIKEFRERLGNDIEISLDFVDKIEPSKSGKFRWVISKVTFEF